MLIIHTCLDTWKYGGTDKPRVNPFPEPNMSDDAPLVKKTTRQPLEYFFVERILQKQIPICQTNVSHFLPVHHAAPTKWLLVRTRFKAKTMKNKLLLLFSSTSDLFRDCGYYRCLATAANMSFVMMMMTLNKHSEAI